MVDPSGIWIKNFWRTLDIRRSTLWGKKPHYSICVPIFPRRLIFLRISYLLLVLWSYENDFSIAYFWEIFLSNTFVSIFVAITLPSQNFSWVLIWYKVVKEIHQRLKKLKLCNICLLKEQGPYAQAILFIVVIPFDNPSVDQIQVYLHPFFAKLL